MTLTESVEQLLLFSPAASQSSAALLVPDPLLSANSQLNSLPLNVATISPSPLYFISFFLVFTCLYFISVVVFKKISWLSLSSSSLPFLAASRITAIVHSSLLVSFLVSRLFFSREQTSTSIHEPDYLEPLKSIDLLLFFWSSAYFIQDLLHLLVLEHGDLAMILHHLGCLLYIATVIAVGRGGLPMLLALFLGETTNPIQSIWALAKLSNRMALYRALSPIFTFVFVFVRALLVPMCVCFIIFGKKGFVRHASSNLVSPSLLLFWTVIILSMMIGSLSWAYKVTRGYLRMRRKEDELTDGKKLK